MTNQQAIAHQIEELDSERVKALVLVWLVETSGSLEDFKRVLSGESDQKTALEYGQIDKTLSFHPMTDLEMVESSLQALDEYKHTGNGISHERVRDWLERLERDRSRFPNQPN